MGINLFVLFLIVFSIIITNLNFEQTQERIQYTNIPLVTFEGSILYELNEQKVTRIINSSQALNYKNRDELYDATILLRNKNERADYISAEYILKKNNLYKLYQNALIDIRSDNNATLMSDYIELDQNNNIIITKNEFDLKFNNNKLYGNNLYFNLNREIMRAENIHFMLKLNKENK